MATSDKYYSFRAVLLALLAGIAMGLLFAPRLSFLHSAPRKADKLSEKMQSVMELVEDEYVDKISDDSAAVLMMNAVMKGLDPHSRYIAAEDLQKEMADIRGNFEGIGATLRSDKDTVYISQTLPGSPAREAGLLTGDRIITVDGDTVSGRKIPIEDVIKRIRGPHDVSVVLGIMHYGDTALYPMVVRRDVIPTNSVSYSGMLDATTGYVRLTRFSETSYQEILEALTNMRAEGMSSLVFDLRDNGGGLLDAAIRIANEFLHRGDLIVYTQGAHQRRNDVRADGRGRFQDISLTVMLDEFSASASEVVSGAIQDNDRGLIVGRRSFGKGLVQRQFDFSDGSAVWLTVARYYTPAGRCIQRPYDKGNDEYYTEYLKQVLDESDADSALAKLTDTTRYFTVKGRVVYGGGGIYPDHLLPYQRDSLIVYYNQLANRRILDRVAFDYVATHISPLMQKYPDAHTFATQFKVSDDLHERIVEAGRKEKLAPNPAMLEKYGFHIDTLFKAYMAEYLYGFESFYAIYTAIDVDLQAVRKLLASQSMQ